MKKKSNNNPVLNPLYTSWGKEIDRDCPLAEYPRPQMKRENWVCLNGVWKYAINQNNTTQPETFDGNILVPFSPESLLSGVNRQLKPGQTLWYSRNVYFDKANKGQRTLLHFGAVDQRCTVYINRRIVGEHSGGYWPFTFDITDFITSGDNALSLCVVDDSDTGDEAYGKQTLDRGGIWYTGQSGIWQTVWCETVPEQYIESLRITPLYRESAVEIAVSGDVPSGTVYVLDGDDIVAEGPIVNNISRLSLPNFKSWSPDSPFLYGIKIVAGDDMVRSYFGMREFGIGKGSDGQTLPFLNGKPIFHNGLLDQGYWSDGMYTPPSDEAMVWEISQIKQMGFNMLRKHIKIEPLRWYYHCDRLGILVWQDFVSGGGPYKKIVTQYLPWLGLQINDNKKNYALFGRKSKAGRDIFIRDAQRTVDLLYNTVSLAVWVPFNEGWGQFDAKQICEMVRKKDSSRQIDHASGYHDQGAGDFHSYHIYYKRFCPKSDKYTDRALALTEFGGYSLPTKGHMGSEDLFGYRIYKTRQELEDAIERLYQKDVFPYIPQGLSALVYTQVSDVEDEINGLFTFDRKTVKVTASRISAMNKKLYTDFDRYMVSTDCPTGAIKEE